MKKYIFFSLLISLFACSSVKVSYDYNREADFSKYKTYKFAEDALNLPIGQLNSERVLKAVENEMAAKGFTKSDDPDVMIDIHIKGKEVTTATANTTGGGPWRYGYGGGFSTTQISYDSYIEGTMFIMMVDTPSEKIVWQGIGTKTINEDLSPEKREESINYAVKQIMTNYPPNTSK